jgi:flagellar motor switch protein FliM
MDPNLTPSNPETVSQSEVEGLLAQIGESGPREGAPALMAERDGSQPHIFRRLSSFSTTELRKLRVRHEEFISSLAARLSVHLRTEIGLKMSSLEAMTFEKFVEELSNPTYLALLKLEPLSGTCFLDIPPRLGLSVVDCELGGPGVCVEEERSLSEIESRVISRFVEINFSEWCSSWSDTLDLRPLLIGHESNVTFVQNESLDTTMLVLGVEVQIGELTQQMHFGFPYLMLEPLIKKLNAEAEKSEKPAAKAPLAALKWNPVLDDVRIPVGIELPGLGITARELAGLKVGDVIAVEPEVFQNVRISLGKKAKFSAVAGRCGSHWAARITKVS